MSLACVHSMSSVDFTNWPSTLDQGLGDSYPNSLLAREAKASMTWWGQGLACVHAANMSRILNALESKVTTK